MPKISVLIVNYNSGDRLKRCLDCLAEQTFKDFETIIIDNASSDNSIEQSRKSFIPFHFIDAGKNLGFAAGNNRASEQASGEWLAFLNPDAYAQSDWLEQLMAATERYPWADAFGSTQLKAEDPTIIDGAGDVFHVFGVYYRGHYGWPIEKLPPDGECFSPCAAAALYRRSTFNELGGFDETFFCYGEDVDLGFRLRLIGGRCIQVKDAVVLHEGSGVTGRYSDFTVYHGHRNRIWVTYKNMPRPLYWILFPVHVLVNLYLLLRCWMIGAGPAGLRAIKDGYCNLSSLRKNNSAPLFSNKIKKYYTWSIIKLVRRKSSLKS